MEVVGGEMQWVAQRELSPSVDDNVVVEEIKWEFTQRELSPGVDNVIVVREMKWEFTSASYRQVTTTTIKQRQAGTDQWLRSDRIPNQRSRFDFRFQGVSVSSSHWSTTLLVFRWEINGGGRRRRNAMSIPRRELFPSVDNDDDKSKELQQNNSHNRSPRWIWRLSSLAISIVVISIILQQKKWLHGLLRSRVRWIFWLANL